MHSLRVLQTFHFNGHFTHKGRVKHVTDRNNHNKYTITDIVNICVLFMATWRIGGNLCLTSNKPYLYSTSRLHKQGQVQNWPPLCVIIRIKNKNPDTKFVFPYHFTYYFTHIVCTIYNVLQSASKFNRKIRDIVLRSLITKRCF